MAGEPYTEYYYKKFSFLNKKNTSIEVKVWCLLPLLNKKIFNKYFPKNQHKIYTHKNFINIENYDALKNEMENYRVLFISQIYLKIY